LRIWDPQRCIISVAQVCTLTKQTKANWWFLFINSFYKFITKTRLSHFWVLSLAYVSSISAKPGRNPLKGKKRNASFKMLRRHVVLHGDTVEDTVTLELQDCIQRSQFIKMLFQSDICPQQQQCDDDGDGSNSFQEPSSSFPQLDISVSAEGLTTTICELSCIKDYLQHFGPGRSDGRTPSVIVSAPSVIRAPLPGPLRNYISDWEYGFIQGMLVDGDVWQHTRLILVLSLANRLKIDPLVQLLSAWCAEQIGTLSRGKSSIDGAEAVRSFFGLPNEWTAEESKHLEREMEYFDSLNHR
jgi:hypothetical protein